MIQFVVIVHVPPLLLVVILSFVTNGLHGSQVCTEFLNGSKCCSFKCTPCLQLTDIDFSNMYVWL